MIRAERIALTRELLDELPDIFRKVLVLRELEGMRYEEMASVLGVSIGTIESRLYRGRARFEKLARAREEDLA
jgi:RNA polymerase sigma-70 factor (ECF subfamily)